MARTRRRHRFLLTLATTGVLAACSNDPGVSTRGAVVSGGARAPATTATTDPTRTAPTDTGPGGTRPDFTLTPLTLPSTSSTQSASVSDPSVPDPATPDTSEVDRASAGDSLFPELGNRDVDVTDYLVGISYRPERTVDPLVGQTVINLTATATVDQLVFDAVGLDIEIVRVDGIEVEFFTDLDEVMIDWPLATGDAASVQLTYLAEPRRGAGGFADVGWFATAGGAYVLNQPDGLRTWMPADDHPADKASWRFELTVPDGLTAIANGEQLPPIDDGLDTTWVWEQREPMSTYLVQVLVGDYVVIDGGMAGTVPLVHVTEAGDEERMQPYLDATAPQLEYFESVFGPYPLDRYGLAFTESVPGLAMETQGRSLFSTDDFAPSASGEIGYFEDLLLSHELAHQWFGNPVTPADGGDLWLGESFATYGQWLWFDHVGRRPISESALAGLIMRQQGGESTGVPTVANMFGVERYDGGAAVLHALRLEIGDGAFFTVLQRWVAEHRGTTQTTAQFIALSEEVAVRSLTAFYDTWLFAETLPAVYPS